MSAPHAVSGAQRLVDCLRAHGVSIVFGLPGVHNLPIWQALAVSDIDLIGVRHEQAAVYAADGYARATGRLGVAIVTSGPGAANTLAATGEAMASHSAVLVIATDIPQSLRTPGVYRGVLHETRDQQAMFTPVTKSGRTISEASEIDDAVAEMACHALADAQGPVYLGIPTDLLSHEVHATKPLQPRSTSAPLVHEDLIARAVDMLEAAERPLIWAGGGALSAQAGPAIADLAGRLAAPVLTTFMARGLLPRDHPCLVPGPVHDPAVGALWDKADLVLAIGTDFDGMMTQNWSMPPPRQLINVNIDPADVSKNYIADIGLVGDARTVTETLLSQLNVARRIDDVHTELAVIAKTINATVLDDCPEAAQMLAALDRVLPPTTVLVADMCIPGYWIGGYRQFSLPRTLQYPVGWGTLGFGFPASIGAAAANAGPVVCIAGDGGFLFACGELATLAETGLPLTVVLVDDGGYGMLRFDQLHAGQTLFGVDLVRPDFSALASAFGITVRAVDGFGNQFEDALTDAVAALEPRVVVVNVALTPPLTTSPRWYRRTQPT